MVGAWQERRGRVVLEVIASGGFFGKLAGLYPCYPFKRMIGLHLGAAVSKWCVYIPDIVKASSVLDGV